MTTHKLQKNQLIEHFSQGCKAPKDWSIGTEHEVFILKSDSLRRFPFEGPISIQTILKAMQPYGWEPIFQLDTLIGLKKATAGGSITIEPGGQFELSGAPFSTLHETKDELDHHLTLIREVLRPISGVILPMGTDPLWTQNEITWIPKGRYDLMRRYMPRKGNLGLSMMQRTCSVQVNLDFESEEDMVTKVKIGLALQPLVTALFASSPFFEDKQTGYQSYRAHIWQHTDPDRCGLLPFVFEEDMGFEKYVDYLLNVPMYFVYRKGRYIDALGQSFKDFIEGRLPTMPGEYATLPDWIDQTSIVFPEVRLKQFIEMRGADCGPPQMMMALPSFWVGLLYDSTAKDEASQLIKDWSVDQILTLNKQAPLQGLQATINNKTLQTIAQEVLDISARGLQRRGKVKDTADESVYLSPLFEIADSGRTIASQMIEMAEKTGNVSDVIRHYIHPPQT